MGQSSHGGRRRSRRVRRQGVQADTTHPLDARRKQTERQQSEQFTGKCGCLGDIEEAERQPPQCLPMRIFARPGGRVGVLAMQSFMFTGSYEKLRARIAERADVEQLAHFGPGLFGIGNPGTLQTVGLVACARGMGATEPTNPSPILAFALTEIAAEHKEAALRAAIDRINRAPAGPSMPGPSPDDANACPTHCLPREELASLPRRTWAYWVDAPLRRAFRDFVPLARIAPPRQGLATTDNFRFVRYAWEVEPTNRQAPAQATTGRWMPYAKGGGFRRWHQAPRHRVNWEDDGREIKQAIVDRYPYLNGQWRWVAKNTGYYGRPGVTWSYLTSGRFSARRHEAGAIFDVAGSSFFPDDIPQMLAILNSSVADRLLKAINPTVNFQVGDLAQLPIPPAIPPELGRLATEAIELQQSLGTYDETAPDFCQPPAWERAAERATAIAARLCRIESNIESNVCELYGVAPAESAQRAAVSAESVTEDRVELARRWVSFAIGLLLGRWEGGPPGRVLQLDPPDDQTLSGLRRVLAERAGESAAREIEGQFPSLARFVATGFFPWHVRQCRRRPPYWALAGAGRCYLLAHDAATPQTLAPVLRRLGASAPAGWNRNVDDGIAVGLAPFRSLVPDSAMRKVLAEVVRESAEGRLAWASSLR